VNCTSNAPSVAPGRHMSGITVIGVSVSCADDSLAAEVRDLLRATDVPTSGESSCGLARPGWRCGRLHHDVGGGDLASYPMG